MHKEPLNDLYALLKVLPTGKLCLTPLCVSTWAWDCSALYWPRIRTVLVLGENSTIRITAITGFRTSEFFKRTLWRGLAQCFDFKGT